MGRFLKNRWVRRLDVYCGIMKNRNRNARQKKNAGKLEMGQARATKRPLKKTVRPDGTVIIMVP